MARSKGDKPSGKFAAVPLSLVKSPEFRSLGGNAVKLLLAIYAQYNGNNNGDLCAAWSVMHEQYGFSSRGTLNRALRELLETELIVRTREGYFQNPGGRCSLYAVTWLPVHDCPGKRLDHRPTIRPLRTFT